MIGKGLGKFKPEHGEVIYKAVFISGKLYILTTINGDIIKSSGVSSSNLNKFHFSNLFKGDSIDIEEER
jgi:hypothetical protein